MRFTFTEASPPTFRESIQPTGYGFRANVNAECRTYAEPGERVLGTSDRVPTQLFNGDAAFVAHLFWTLAVERL